MGSIPDGEANSRRSWRTPDSLVHVRSSLGGGVGAKYLRGLGEVLGVRLVTKAFQLSPDLRGAFRRGFYIIVTRI